MNKQQKQVKPRQVVYRKYKPKAAMQSMPVVSGSGAYRRRRKDYSKSSSMMPANQSIGATIGSKVGGFLGDLGQRALTSLVTGFGDYAPITLNPKENSFMKELDLYGPPAIVNTTNRSVVIRHREFIADIRTGSAGAFNLQTFAINPGLSTTFPWLSSVASNFQEYRPLGMFFEFRSTSADALNSTNTQLGTTILATDYDATDVVSVSFQNKQMMMNHEFAQSAKQSCSILHPIECASNKNPLGIYHVRTTDEPANADKRFTDIGTLGVATFGQQGSNISIGELWVSYEIEFLKPQAINLIGAEVLAYKAFSNTAVSTSAYFGTPASIVVRNNSSLAMTVGTASLAFPANLQSGSYLVIYSLLGGSVAAVTPPTVTPVGCTIPLYFTNGVNGSIQAPTPSATAQALILSFIVNITAPGASVTFSSGVLPSSANMDLLVVEWNGLITN